MFFLKDRLSKSTERMLSGFAAGVMVAASIWSLLIPAMNQCADKGRWAFLDGALSGAVEPIAAGLGLLLAFAIDAVMPWAMAFAGGCMLYVIAEEMIPEFSKDSVHHYGVWSFIIGFAGMMCLDVALG